MRCLIVGQDGSIGAALTATLRARGHAVMATTRRPERVSDDVLLWDLADSPPPFAEIDIAIICAAVARFEDCRREPELARRINVLAPMELARSLTARGARVLYLSTSAVFDCLTPHRAEDDHVAPRSAYGHFKAEAEATLLGLGSLVSVLRLTKVVKPGTGILSEWIKAFGRGGTVRAFDDHRFCPLPVDAVNHAIAVLVDKGQSGIYQVSGAEDVSYAEAALYLASEIGVDEARVEAVRAVGNGVAEHELTPFTSLATRRLTQLCGFVPPAPFDVLGRIYGDEIHAAREALASDAV